MPDTDPVPAGTGQQHPTEVTAEDCALLGAQPLRRSDPRDIGPYRVLARLGGGGMGRLFLARDASAEGTYASSSLIAVKVIRSEYAEDERFRRRFEREIETVRRVHGAYTAELLGTGLDQDELLWMANAYVPGLSLADAVLGYGPLPAPVVWRLAYEIAQALTAISAAGIVHRDLKPSNVLMGPDGTRVIDFGVAHTVDASSLTMTGQQLGTPAFMSPEQANGHEVSTASDVFSLGSVLAVAVTGSAPFGEGISGDIIHRVIYAPPSDDVLTAVRQRDAALGELVAQCLDKDPARRPSPQDVADVTREHTRGETWPEQIAEVIDSRAEWRGTAVVVPPMDQLTVLRRTTPERTPEQPGAKRRWPLAVAVVAAAAAAVLGLGQGSGHGGGAANSRAGQRSSATATSSPSRTSLGKPRHTATRHPTSAAPPAQPPGGSGAPPVQPPAATNTPAPPQDPGPGQPTHTTTAPAPPPPKPTPAPEPWKSCTYYSGTALTVYGNKGDRVKEVQCILRARGYNIGPAGVDGDFGADTLTEVKHFQRVHGLRVDGQVGVNTWRALRA
ncbi:protein kinase domain-containing protein [Streptomyces sp. NPDC002172]